MAQECQLSDSVAATRIWRYRIQAKTVYKNRLIVDFEAESVQLIQAENQDLPEDVGCHHRNVDKLVRMLTVVSVERNHLRKEVAAKGQTSLLMSSLSQNNQQLYQQNRRLQHMMLKLADPRN